MKLIEAIKEGDIEAVKQAIAAGTDVNAPDIGELTPLHSAAAEGHKDVVELLIANGADVNAKNSGGDGVSTPLHNAAMEGHKEIVELLIANGADVNAIDDFYKATPLDYAVDEGKEETADRLRKHGGKTG